MHTDRFVATTRPKPLHTPKDASTLRLYCFPYAGGDAEQVFSDWGEALEGIADVRPVSLAGRGRRIREAASPDFARIVEEIVDVIIADGPGPFGFFGHSFGALLAFEVARVLESRGAGPAFVFASARQAPGLSSPSPLLSSLPAEEFWSALQSRYGSPNEGQLVQDEDLRRILERTTATDVALSERYLLEPGAHLQCPIYGVHGLKDTALTAEDVAAWAEVTTGSFRLFKLPGDHYFVHKNRNFLFRYLRKAIDASTRSSWATGRPAPEHLRPAVSV